MRNFECQEAGGKVSTACQVAAYVCLSRVKELLKICVLQPFSPLLFTRGPPKGPGRLIRKLTGAITVEEVLEEWNQDGNANEDANADNTTDPMKQKFVCTSCYLEGKQVYSHSVDRFGVLQSTDFYAKLVSQGAWTRCLKCQEKYGAWTQLPSARSSKEEALPATTGSVNVRR